MIDITLSLIAPHYCCGCDKIGSLLCDNCKYNIIYDHESVCLACKRPVTAKGICNTCRPAYKRAWSVGARKDVLQRLIGLYKFERAKSAYKIIGELLLDVIPFLPPETIVVPIPTVSGHIRERGYDHTLLISRYVAKKRSLKLQPLLVRKSSSMQRHASASSRDQQAKGAFEAKGIITEDTPYLLIDDVTTTGATLKYATKVLKEAGAKTVYVAVVAYQTLD